MIGKKRGNTVDERIEFAGIKFTVVRKKIKYFRVSFSPEKTVISAPYFGNVNRFLKENIIKIVVKSKQLNDRIEKSLSIKLFSRSDEEFKEIIKAKLLKFSTFLGVEFTDIKFRKMKRTMGNCRNDGTLTFNTALKYMPENIIGYIVFHELLHLKIKGGHSNAFRRKIRESFPDYKVLDEKIRQYLLRINFAERK